MQFTQTSEPDRTAHAIGVLCLGGDWACAHGDLEALADVARRLANYAGEPLRRELIDLSDTCRCDPDLATSAWMQLKERVQRSIVR